MDPAIPSSADDQKAILPIGHFHFSRPSATLSIIVFIGMNGGRPAASLDDVHCVIASSTSYWPSLPRRLGTHSTRRPLSSHEIYNQENVPNYGAKEIEKPLNFDRNDVTNNRLIDECQVTWMLYILKFIPFNRVHLDCQ